MGLDVVSGAAVSMLRALVGHAAALLLDLGADRERVRSTLVERSHWRIPETTALLLLHHADSLPADAISGGTDAEPLRLFGIRVTKIATRNQFALSLMIDDWQ